MTPKATIRDVAAEAGVSVATVSRAIHHNGYISKENQERIDEAIKKLGYVERRSSKEVPTKLSKPSNQSRTIAVIGGIAQEHTFLPRLAYSLSIAANNAGFYTLYIAEKPDNSNLSSILDTALEENVCGIIISDFTDEPISRENKDLILQLPVPVVIIERAVCTELNSVQIDSRQGIYLACKHLYETGRHNLVYLTGPISGSVEKERLLGFQDAASEYGHKPEVHICKSTSREDCFNELTGIFEGNSIPDGIVAWSDLFAITARQFLYERNISVPDDVAIFGYDDFLASYTAPPLSTVRAPLNELATVAISIIRDNLNNTGEFFARNIKLTPNIVLRAST